MDDPNDFYVTTISDDLKFAHLYSTNIYTKYLAFPYYYDEFGSTFALGLFHFKNCDI